MAITDQNKKEAGTGSRASRRKSKNQANSKPAANRASKTKNPKTDETNEIGMVRNGENDLERLIHNFMIAKGNKVVYRDLNGRYSNPTFNRYTKDDIQKYIANPAQYETQLRDAVIYIYGASSHFRRLIKYFVGLTDFAYIVTPSREEAKKNMVKTIQQNYRKTLATLSAMNIRTQGPDILTVCLREDVYYGTMWITDTSIIFQRLDSNYCKISTIEDNVFNVSFDFSYFDSHENELEFYPKEFQNKYSVYQKDRLSRWIELDSPTSFAIKANTDITTYAMPPFAGVLRELYDLEDYKSLKLSKTALENYALLNMKLPFDKEGEFLLPFNKAKDFWYNLDSVLPEEVGSVLSPMEIDKIDFQKSNTGDMDTISDAEQNLFTAAGVSSLLFNNEKASANALSLSIMVDQEITYGIVKSIECMINRYLLHQKFGEKFKVTFLNCSTFNRKEVGDQYLKAAQYGLPTVMMYAASQGLSQAEVDLMTFLENDVLNLKELLIPLQSSATQSGTMTEGGRPEKESTELTDSGEQSREDKDDW